MRFNYKTRRVLQLSPPFLHPLFTTVRPPYLIHLRSSIKKKRIFRRNLREIILIYLIIPARRGFEIRVKAAPCSIRRVNQGSVSRDSPTFPLRR